jgi:hypothetical protein
MFFMNDKALQELDKANGFEVGVGPSVVVMEEGMAKSSTTTTMKDDIYAFIFGQKGLMAAAPRRPGSTIDGLECELRRPVVVQRLSSWDARQRLHE